MINAAAAGSEEAAAETVKEAGSKEESEKDADDDECGTCGEGIEGQEAGRRKTIRVKTPYKPSQDEVDDHDLTHLPYRS